MYKARQVFNLHTQVKYQDQVFKLKLSFLFIYLIKLRIDEHQKATHTKKLDMLNMFLMQVVYT